MSYSDLRAVARGQAEYAKLPALSDASESDAGEGDIADEDLIHGLRDDDIWEMGQ